MDQASPDDCLRTLLYAISVFVARLREKVFEARDESGGFGSLLTNLFHHREIPHVWANTIAVGWALLVFNALTVLREYVGDDKLLGPFLSTRSEQMERTEP